MGRKSDAKERMLGVARNLFWERSCGAVSVDAVCREAGVNKGSFYHFFESKAEIILAVIDEAWRGYRQDVLEPSFSPDVDPVSRVERYFMRVYEMQLDQKARLGKVLGCPFCNIGSELSTQEEAVRKKVEDIHGRQITFIVCAVAEAFGVEGDGAEDPEVLARVLQSMLSGASLASKVANDPRPVLDCIPAARRLFGQVSGIPVAI